MHTSDGGHAVAWPDWWLTPPILQEEAEESFSIGTAAMTVLAKLQVSKILLEREDLPPTNEQAKIIGCHHAYVETTNNPTLIMRDRLIPANLKQPCNQRMVYTL